MSKHKLYSVVEPLPLGEHGTIAYKRTSHPNNIKEKNSKPYKIVVNTYLNYTTIVGGRMLRWTNDRYAHIRQFHLFISLSVHLNHHIQYTHGLFNLKDFSIKVAKGSISLSLSRSVHLNHGIQYTHSFV
jgi:hypothetical protein